MQWFTSGGALAVLAFVMWWLISKFIPEERSVFSATIKEIQAVHAQAMNESRKDFLAALQRTEDFGKERDKALVQALENHTIAITSLANLVKDHDTSMKIAHAVELQNRRTTERVVEDIGMVGRTARAAGVAG